MRRLTVLVGNPLQSFRNALRWHACSLENGNAPPQSSSLRQVSKALLFELSVRTECL